MIIPKSLRNLSLLLLLIAAIISGCTGGYESVTKQTPQNKSDSKDLYASKTMTNKLTLNDRNLECLSSSLAGFINSSVTKSDAVTDEVMYKVIEYLNTPYLWGGTSKRGIDCSGFVQAVMYQSLGIKLPRTSYEQSNVGTDVSVSELSFGDLLFFDTMNKGRVSHVGIYLSDGYFVHSGSRTGVIVTSLNNEPYSRVFIKAKRVIE
ncbi:MAG: NlpC/P60 family protein [Ignavibacteria bacterium]|nr:NlpC/P60 family protein [Ignavibacteria bacterium]